MSATVRRPAIARRERARARGAPSPRAPLGRAAEDGHEIVAVALEEVTWADAPRARAADPALRNERVRSKAEGSSSLPGRTRARLEEREPRVGDAAPGCGRRAHARVERVPSRTARRRRCRRASKTEACASASSARLEQIPRPLERADIVPCRSSTTSVSKKRESLSEPLGNCSERRSRAAPQRARWRAGFLRGVGRSSRALPIGGGVRARLRSREKQLDRVVIDRSGSTSTTISPGTSIGRRDVATIALRCAAPFADGARGFRIELLEIVQNHQHLASREDVAMRRGSESPLRRRERRAPRDHRQTSAACVRPEIG